MTNNTITTASVTQATSYLMDYSGGGIMSQIGEPITTQTFPYQTTTSVPPSEWTTTWVSQPVGYNEAITLEEESEGPSEEEKEAICVLREHFSW